ncbi:MAG: amidohydrolase [Rhizobiaceae bacterium]|nr:amidohydrolase [Rhizobiaceae bacterium]
MTFTNADLTELTEWRRELHRHPEISGEEEKTAAAVVDFLADTKPDEVVTGLGGHGVAAIYGSGRPGPTILLRSELDALPIQEVGDTPHKSLVQGKSHMCGHEGHTTILAAVARQLARRRPATGRVVLMFQPAEETGKGAAGVTADPRYDAIRPDYALSLHNLPGVPFGHARLKEGVVNCASRGIRILLDGRTAHASMPETGIAPTRAVARLLPALEDLSHGRFGDDDFALVTVCHARVGEAVFGIAPGHAEIRATLRTRLDERMDDLVSAAEELASRVAAGDGLRCAIDYDEIFVASMNDADAVACLASALEAENVPFSDEGLPMRASEDFGLFGRGSKSAMFFLGAGMDLPALHNPDYDFPDDLIPVGARVFVRVVRQMLG